MARTVIRHVTTRIRRRLRADTVVKYGLCLTIFIFLVFLLGLIPHSEVEYINTEHFGEQPDIEEEEKKKEDHHVIPIPEQEPQPPLVGPGEMGEAVNISKDSLGTEEKKIFEDGFKANSFNQYASDMISIKRKLPDMRPKECKETKHLDNLPDTSVIVCFHNEAWSTLLRSMHSILDRTPSKLLTEIIFVDDASTHEHLKKRLDDYIARYPKVKIVRAKERIGLIKARLLGYKHAKGTVLTFLDSHIECTEGWLEPLLDRIARNTSNVVWPVIDVINFTTFEYKDNGASGYGTQVGGFDWGLQFNWHKIPDRDNYRRAHPHAPVRSPTMAGGLFSIDRKYFEYLGTYDEDFDIWGGENLEISFKTWMCGGTLEMVPCSRVGHIFRETSPYKWREGKDVLKKNLVRLAEVWLDDYKKYYFERIQNDTGDFGDISSRVELRKKLKCHSFQWYIDNVYPEMFIPDKAQAWGGIRNEGYDEKHCMDAVVEDKSNNKTVDVWPCHGQGGNQYFSYSFADEIRRDDKCVDYGKDNHVIMFSCHGGKGNQHWVHDQHNRTIRHPPSRKCLEMDVEAMSIILAPCNASIAEQRWIFSSYAEDGQNRTLGRNSPPNPPVYTPARFV